ncbi:MAG TPA: TonB-dependent receptor [Gemmatimonadota bacterium]|nr:TonB-dependent receptor [Gemmatimonadota bacterium]
MSTAERSVRILVAATLAAAALAARPAPSAAQAPGDTAARSRSDTVLLPGLVVTAYRMPVPRDAVVSDVTVLDSARIRAAGALHVLDLLRRVPAAQVVQTGPWGSPASLFLRGGESNYVKVLVDGVPVNQAGGDFDFSSLTTTGVRRIEIVRGPASVLYGSDAVSGVVQIFTDRGRGPPTVHASARAGSYASLDGTASVRGGSETVRYGASVGRFSTDGTLPYNDAYRNTTATGSVRLLPDPATRATLTARWDAFTAHFPTDGTGRVVDRNQFRDGRSLSAGLTLSRRLSDAVGVRLQLADHEARSHLRDARDGPSDTTGFYANHGDGRQARRSADLRVDLRPTSGTVVSLGGTWERETGRDSSRSVSPAGASVSRTDGARRDAGAYVQVLSRPVAGLSLTAGARVDDDQAFGTWTTWRAGAAYRLPWGTRFRAAAGTGFKEPTFFESFGSSFVNGNPELEPEHSRSWEVGARQPLLGDRMALHATWFDQRFEDLIQFTFSPPSASAPNYFNVPSAAARGLEAGLEARPWGELSLHAGWTWLHTETLDAGFDSGPDATFVEGEPLLRRARHSGEAGATWTPRSGSSVTVSVTAVGPREDRDFSAYPARRVELPGYVRADLSARWRLLDGGPGRPPLAATLRVDNVLDRRYVEAVGFPARGRTILVGAETGLAF